MQEELKKQKEEEILDGAQAQEKQPQLEEEQPTDDTLPSEQPTEVEEQKEAEEPIAAPEVELNSQPEPTPEPTFTQSQLNEIVGRTRAEAREKATRAYFDRYGVENDDELNAIFGKGQSYDVLNDNFNRITAQMNDVMAENALLKSGISQERWDDARLILNGKGLDITTENIASELITHPEWKAAPDMPETLPNENKPSIITKLGIDVPENEEKSPSEEELAKRLFGI